MKIMKADQARKQRQQARGHVSYIDCKIGALNFKYRSDPFKNKLIYMCIM